MYSLVRSENPAFWCGHVCSATGYRRCPIAISPNLSNLQPTVHQITVGIERMHDERTCVAMLAVRLHFPPLSLPLGSLPSYPLMSQSSLQLPSATRRVGVGSTLRFRLRARRPSITVTTTVACMAAGCSLNGK